MRGIFKKLDRGQRLDAEEYRLLMEHLEDMGRRSPQSYLLFFHQYADVLEQEYATSLPRFWWGFDDLLNFLLSHHDLVPELLQGRQSWERFPVELRPYLKYTFHDTGNHKYLQHLLGWFTRQDPEVLLLPSPREGKIVSIYEDANPYKEMGLKAHFDRLSSYSFITRLQTYRYLTRHKAHHDRFEVIAHDKLGGIFTNKEKSLYYFIFLTEENLAKAGNACHVLNLAFNGFSHQSRGVE